MDISSISSIYFVGIKGIAMTSLAVYAQERGIVVSGSDIAGEFPSTEILASRNINVVEGFSPDHISAQNPDIVVYTGAHGGRDNVEVQEAIRLGIPAMSHAEALGEYMSDTIQLSVAGSHGKTTTSAMTALIFTHAKKHASYAIGSGMIRGLGLPGHFDTGEHFIAEADEYVTDPKHDATPRFLWQKPHGLIITNIDFDHPDVYANIGEVKKAFQGLVHRMKSGGVIVYDKDDAQNDLLYPAHLRILSVGQSEQADYQVTDISHTSDTMKFSLVHGQSVVGRFQLQIPGVHNAKNAAMAAVLAHEYGVHWEQSIAALATFGGAKRRFEHVGTIDECMVFDDYAHHPAEIRTTIQAAKDRFPHESITVIFQPHTYSRTKSLLRQFGEALSLADTVLLADVYASAREVMDPSISSSLLAESIEAHTHTMVVGEYDGAKAFLLKNRPLHGIILCMGAGDIASWAKRLVHDWKS